MKKILTEEEHNKGFNQCDKCFIKEPSEDLVWISAEDFEPKPNEVLKESAKKYQALCESCYLEELER